MCVEGGGRAALPPGRGRRRRSLAAPVCCTVTRTDRGAQGDGLRGKRVGVGLREHHKAGRLISVMGLWLSVGGAGW